MMDGGMVFPITGGLGIYLIISGLLGSVGVEGGWVRQVTASLLWPAVLTWRAYVGTYEYVAWRIKQ